MCVLDVNNNHDDEDSVGPCNIVIEYTIQCNIILPHNVYISAVNIFVAKKKQQAIDTQTIEFLFVCVCLLCFSVTITTAIQHTKYTA